MAQIGRALRSADQRQHVGRNGELIVCWSCQISEHSACLQDGMVGTLRCHCPTCYPAPCPQCFPTDGPAHGNQCPNCFTEMPITNRCDYC